MARRKSRAARLDEQCAFIRADLELLELIRQHPSGKKSRIKRANDVLDNMAYSEIENIRDEIVDWKSNIEEKFSSTQKYSDLEECESELESALSAFQDAGSDKIESLEDIDDRIQSIEEGLDYCANVNFPRMFG